MGLALYPLFRFRMLAESYMTDFDDQISSEFIKLFQQKAAREKVMSQTKQEP